MLRKIISAVIIVIALIVLFFLIRAGVNAIRGNDDPKSPVQTEATVSDPAENPASENRAIESDNKPANLPATNSNGNTSSTNTNTGSGTVANPSASAPAAGTAANPQLAAAGPAETFTAIVAVTAALGTVFYVRRRQLARS